MHLQHLGHPIANDTQYGGPYGGPLASRQMAQHLGVHWTTARARERSQGGANGAAGASGGAEGVPGAAGAACSKRARLEAPTTAEAAPQQVPAAAGAAVDEAGAAARAAGGEAAGVGEEGGGEEGGYGQTRGLPQPARVPAAARAVRLHVHPLPLLRAQVRG